MGTRLKIKRSELRSDLVLYAAIIPFFMPKGFMDLSNTYSTIYKAVLALGTIIVLFVFGVYLIRRRSVLSGRAVSILFSVLLCHAILAVITLIEQGGITQGLQKIFIAPAVFFIVTVYSQKRGKELIKCLSNVLIILFLLNISIFGELVFPNQFAVNKHMMFMGHVQIMSQLGLLGLFLGWMLGQFNYKRKSAIISILSVANMLYSRTAASYLVVILFLLFWLFRKAKFHEHFFAMNSKVYLIIYYLINIVLFAIVYGMHGHYVINGINLSGILSGRTFVWAQVFLLLSGHWLFGYGAYGVLIRTFWSEWSNNPLGFNYAHNEILQLLIDGGVVLLASYTYMLVVIFSDADKVNGKFQQILKEVIFTFLMVSVAESTTEYFYMFWLLALIAYGTKIEAAMELEKHQYV